MKTLKVSAFNLWNCLNAKWTYRIQSHMTSCASMDSLSRLEKEMVLKRSAHSIFILGQATTEVFWRLLAHHFKAAIIKKRFQFIQTWISLYQRKKAKYHRQNPNYKLRTSLYNSVKNLNYSFYLKMSHFHSSQVEILKNLWRKSQGWSIIVRCLLWRPGYLKLRGF